MHLIYDIVPVPAPRMTRRDRWNPRNCVIRYHLFRDRVAELDIIVLSDDTLTFVMPMPKSWSKAKRAKMNGKPHKQKPDLDNLVKALLDAAFRFKDDSHIHSINAAKQWGEKGLITIERELN